MAVDKYSAQSAFPRRLAALIRAAMQAAEIASSPHETAAPHESAINAALPQTAPIRSPSVRNLGPLRMIWAAALRYPARIAVACGALSITALSTLAFPWSFSQIVEHGFASGSDRATVDFWYEAMLANEIGRAHV